MTDPAPKLVRKAIASLVLGLLSIAASILAGIPAILLGVFAINDIKRDPGRRKGRGLAIAGIVLGSIGSSSVVVALPAYIVYDRIETARRQKRQVDDEARHKLECGRNLAEIGQALRRHVARTGQYPRDGVYGKGLSSPLGWRVAILPELGPEAAALHARFHLDEPYDSPHNKALVDLMPPVFACPSSTSPIKGLSSFVAVTGKGTAFPGDTEPAHKSGVRAGDLTDDPSKTLVAFEILGGEGWSRTSGPFSSYRLQMDSAHADGFHALFADGTVRFLPDKTARATLDAMATRSGGEAAQ